MYSGWWLSAFENFQLEICQYLCILSAMAKHEINEIVVEIMARDAEPISFETVVQNILDEPIAAKTKRRILSPLLPREYGPARPMYYPEWCLLPYTLEFVYN